jgi:hypothetical protein
MLAPNAHRFGQGGLREPYRPHELFRQDFADADRLAFRSAHLPRREIGRRRPEIVTPAQAEVQKRFSQVLGSRLFSVS